MSRILAASKKQHAEKAEKQQQRLSKEERLAMESWMQMDREYAVGTSGNAMTNLRWINGAASKGLKTANADSKDATQTGAYMSLAKFVNTKLSLKQPWTVDTAMTKWKNMKTSFKRICKDNQFPVDAEWYAQGKTKEGFRVAANFLMDNPASAKRAKVTNSCNLGDICGLPPIALGSKHG